MRERNSIFPSHAHLQLVTRLMRQKKTVVKKMPLYYFPFYISIFVVNNTIRITRMRKTIHIFICSLMCLLTLHANDINFSQISSKNGLSQNTVRAIATDKNGFIWAGTLDGLNRYDGYNIRSYQLVSGDMNTLNDHRIRGLFTTRNGDLWVKTYRNEFSYYDPVKDALTPIKDESGKLFIYENFYESGMGDIWFWGNTDGAMRLRTDSNNDFEKKVFFPSAAGCNFLMEDSSGAIWIGTKNGLKRVTEKDSEENYYNNTYHFTQAIEINGMIYFSTLESELLIYSIKQNTFDEIVPTFNAGIIKLFRLSSHELLIFTDSQEVWVYNIPANSFHRSELNNDPHFKTDVRPTYDNKKGVWFYNKWGMLWYCSGEDSKVRKIRLVSDEAISMIESGLHSFTVDAVLADSEGLFWLITYGYGLYCYNPVDGSLTNYTNQPDQSSLASNYLLSITEDRYGNIWIGSEYAGLIRAVKNPEYIRIVRPETGSIIGKTNNVRSIYEDSRGYIWIGLKNGSLYVYNSDMTKGKCIGEGLNPYTLIEDDQQRMWIGSKGYGVYLYDIHTFKEIAHFQHQSSNPVSLENDVIFHIIKDRKSRMWIASFGGGISLAQENGQNITFRNFITNKGNRSMLRYLYQDNKGLIWAGSNDGLIRFNPDELIRDPEAYICYNMDINCPYSLSSNDIKTIYQDEDGTIWIGTAGGGLSKYVEATENDPEHFISFTINQGMPDNYVLGILESGNDLWLSNENGLTRFNKKNHAIVTYQFAQKAYANIYNEGANFKRKDGTMLWGSLDGLMIFNPEKFNPDTNAPAVLLTGLQIDGTDWNNINSSSGNKSITYTKQIKLNYKQNIFTVEFASLNLRNPEKNQYTYILENYDKSWSIPSPSNTATYKNLSPGKYVFKVKGSNSYGIWNDEITSLVITITPPFWKSTVAYIIYLLLIIILLYITFRLIAKFNRLNNAIEVEKQLTNHKLRFFTNISHEFRTPLTLIQGAVDNLNESIDLPDSAQKQLNVLQRNSVNLRRLIDQLLEFRKLQNDILKLDLEEVNMVDFTKDIFLGFQELAVQKSITYQFVSPLESLVLYIDRKKMDKVIYNLLSNAFKFTPKGGTIELSLTEDGKSQKCIISVTDSGVGIPKEKQHLLFSRFSQINFSNSGTGIGLSLVKEFMDVHKGKIYFESNPAGGSIFTIELSSSKEIYAGENFVTTQQHPDITIEDSPSKPVAMPLDKNNTDVEGQVLANYRILIIDDNDDIRSFLQDGFSDSLIVDTAIDGKEGLQKAIETNPDIIICDVMMPEMDGFEVTRQLKSEFQTCHIPIILLTAHSSIEHQLEGIDSGADAYITKPFSLKFVQKRVMKLIEQRESLKKRFSKEFVIDGNLINTTDKDKEFFEKIEKILDENYQNSTFTIDKFVELSGIRRTIFFKKVKGITGFSPNELIKMKRLNRSALLLKQGEFNVSEISYKVGFEDPYYFSKCFKSHFNCTPSEYKKNNLINDN